MKNNRFYHFNQNNSGGYFIEDDNYGICEDVIIEAPTAKDAFAKLEAIEADVPNLFNYCSCCGERWYNWQDDSDGTETPQIYDEPVEIVKAGMFRKKCYVHYMNGSIKLFTHKEK